MKGVSKSRRRLLQLTGTTCGAALLPSKPAQTEERKIASQKPESARVNAARGFFNADQRQLVDELTETSFLRISFRGANAAKVLTRLTRV
jgi:hypothetical protein